MKKLISYTLLLFATLAVGCKELFEIETGWGRGGFLVVDGYINVGEGPTTIKLARTTPIDEPSIQTPETEAAIFVEDSQFTYPLVELTPGVYQAELGLPADHMYRLRIVTKNGNIYLSEYSSPIISPPIDSVVWRQESNNLHVLVNTHDPLNQTHYYQWNYEEVWETQSVFLSLVKYVGGQFVNRPNQEIKDMRTCWKYESDRTLNVASSEELTNDAIVNHTILTTPLQDERLSVRYSILVKQHALSQEAHEFFQVLIKNNESMGTFSDPQPSQLNGNVYRENSNEIVVGFVEAYSTETKRIFINRSDLSGGGYNPACEERLFLFEVEDIDLHMNFYTPTRYQAQLINDRPVQTGVFATLHACADCRISGGTNVIPPFWNISEE